MPKAHFINFILNDLSFKNPCMLHSFQEYTTVVVKELDKLLEKVIKALNNLDELYKETVIELSKQFKGALKGRLYWSSLSDLWD